MEACMYDINDIKNYILYLRNKCGLSITLHTMEDENIIVPSELFTFNIHDNSYCICVKSSPEAFGHCIKRQNLIKEKCSEGAFCGVCYAGVKEYVYPITKQGKTVGFICVSGYRCDNAESYIEAVADKYHLSAERLNESYHSLKSEMPTKEETDTLLIPLCNMLELAYIKSESGVDKDEPLTDKIIRYIKRYHTQDITLEDICKEFSCSRSHISHMFKKCTGKSFREYLTGVRLSDAESLLKYSELSVTEIAFSVGFADANYFSGVFKKRVGMSPMAYRRSVRE